MAEPSGCGGYLVRVTARSALGVRVHRALHKCGMASSPRGPRRPPWGLLRVPSGTSRMPRTARRRKTSGATFRTVTVEVRQDARRANDRTRPSLQRPETQRKDAPRKGPGTPPVPDGSVSAPLKHVAFNELNQFSANLLCSAHLLVPLLPPPRV